MYHPVGINKDRAMFFSDAIFAIAMTIMVLQLRHPVGHDWASLSGIWPTLGAYVLAFVSVGTYWVNHHHVMEVVVNITGPALWLNLVLLFWISLIPYATQWVGDSRFAALPISGYAFLNFMCSMSFAILTVALQACDPAHKVLAEAIGTGRKEKASLAGHAFSIALPFTGEWGACGALLIMAALALMWFIPDVRIERRLRSNETVDGR